MKNHLLSLTLATALISAGGAHAQFVLTEGSNPFEPSFRGDANTTYFGWTDGTFDGTPDNELVDDPAVTLGTAIPGISLTQVGTNDILASSNNIYSPGFATLNLVIPTAGTVGSGFTTIIIQGRATSGGMPGLTTAPVFGSINGVAPEFISGGNSAGKTQWWAKYELPGNAATYAVTLDLPGSGNLAPVSIASFTVETLWSADGYADDFLIAAVPEPGTYAVGAILVLCAAMARRRRVAR